MSKTIRKSTVALILAAGMLAPAAVRSEQNSPGTHILTFQESVPPAERARLAAAAGVEVVKELPFIDGLLVRLPAFAPAALQLLSASPAVEGLEENAYRKWIEAAPAALSPAEPLTLETALMNTLGRIEFTPRPAKPKEQGSEVPWGIERVKAPKAWAKTQGAGVKVAVIDTGIDFKHPDIAPNYGGGVNVVEEGASPMDDNGHGTHVAGTIAAVKDNKGVVGVAPKAKVYAIKVLDKDGGGDTEGIVAGIAWAVKNKMKVINMSLGGPSSAAMTKAVKKAYDAGVTVVAAAGNDPDAPVSAPARYPQSIAVSASTKEDKLAFFSTTGPEIAVIAPGHEITSLAPGGGYAKHSGTSMACPHVAGLAALAVSLGASGPKAVRDALAAAAVPLEKLTADQQGKGMVEADRLR